MRVLAFGALLASISGVASAAEGAGIKLDERTRLGTCELVLNGAGLRRKASLKIDVAGLYLTEKRTTPADVLAPAGPKRARITLMRNLPAPELAEALTDGIREISSPEEQQAVRAASTSWRRTWRPCAIAGEVTSSRSTGCPMWERSWVERRGERQPDPRLRRLPSLRRELKKALLGRTD